MPLEGQQIGRYCLLHLLGSGGMGEVYLAEDPRIEQQIAIKVIRADASPYPDTRATKDAARLFQREAKAIARLDHPHILSLFDYGEEIIGNMTIAYLVMSYRKEGSLADWLRRRNKTGLLSPLDVAHIVVQAADALQHAHDHQIIHQDVKPSNFLIRERKEASARPDLLLSDFGIARLASSASSASQSVRGTPTYMAPEQWYGEPVPATDQYALAVMAYQLLTDHLPFEGAPGRMMYQHINVQPPSPSTFDPHLSKDIDTVILHALAKKPEERFASIAAFANAFQQAVQGIQEVQAPPTVIVSNTVFEASAEEAETSAPAKAANESIYSATNSPPSRIIEVPAVPVIQANASPENEVPIQRTTVDARATRQNKDKELVPPAGESGTSAPRRRRKRSPLLVVALVLLMLGLIVGGIAYAMPGVFTGIAKSVFGTSAKARATVSSRPSIADAAVVTVTPASKDLQNVYTISAITGTPDASKHQVGARLLSATTQSQSQTANATGAGTSPATPARGTLTFYNCASSPTSVPTGSTYQVSFYDTNPNVEVITEATAVLGTGNCSTTPQKYSTATVPAHTIQTGSTVNITRQAVYAWDNVDGWGVENDQAFTGGQNAQTYTAVQQSDIDNTANALINANTPDAQQVLQPQIRPNERLIGTPQCNPNVASNHVAGDKATSVTVAVTFTCTGEVYDYKGALALGTKLLTDQAAKDPGAGYVLVGKIKTTLTDATVVDAKQGTVKLTVNAEGVWVYQFSDAQKQVLAKLLAGKKRQDAQALLLAQKGVAKVDGIEVSGGDGNTMPTDPGRIKIVVQSVPV
jgi:VCBS repeat-containing protein